MRTLEGREIDGQVDRGGTAYGDVRLMGCRFLSCGLSVGAVPTRRTRVSNTHLQNCEQRGSVIAGAQFEDCSIEGLKTNGVLQVWAAVFRRVRLTGQIERLMLSPRVYGSGAPGTQQRAYDDANAEFYRDTDWALDISEARFKECDLTGVPAPLVRRDPATQVVVTRQGADAGAWREASLEETYWPTALERFLSSGRPDIVLVAPKASPRFQRLLKGLKLLQEIGTALP